MLVLSRHKDESIIIGDDVRVTVVEIRGNKIRLGVDAPKHVPVHRHEVWEERQSQLSAVPAGPPQCQACGWELELIQPMADDPDRLLGVCPKCRAWTGLNVTGDGGYTLATVPGLTG